MSSSILADAIAKYKRERPSKSPSDTRIQGAYRLRLYNAPEHNRLVGYGLTHDDAVERCLESDTGICKNVVTDFGRRYLLNNPWSTGAFNMFIGQCTNPGIVRRTSLQYIYAVQSPAQVRAPDTSTNDITLLIQTRIVEFPAPSATRTISIVGLTPSTITTSENAIHAIVAYSKLTSPSTQTTTSAADLSYTVTWSFT